MSDARAEAVDRSGTVRLPESREAAEALDRADPLAAKRAAFDMPAGIYLDGNSLGPLPHAVRRRLRHAIDVEWGEGLIASWNDAGWIDLPSRIGARIAPLVGAAPEGVRVCDSTSVNLFKVLAAALALRPERRVIVSERSNFPTDLYVAEGLSGLLAQGHELRLVDDASDIVTALDGRTAVLMLTHVDYRTGALHDMKALTRAAHECGALTVWDLAHSAGALPVDLEGCGADFAVGCGYKYLNGGPGAPAFVAIARRHLADARNPLSGWFAHAEPFAFEPTFRATEGADRFLVGTPPVLSTVALDAALDVWSDVDIGMVREKSLALTGLFIARVEAECANDAGGATDSGGATEAVPSLVSPRLVSPRDGSRRGSQVSFSHPEAHALVRCLIEQGVTGDFRAPDIARFGFAPLYTRHVDAWDAAARLGEILRTRAHDRPRFHRRRAVT